MDNMDNDVIKGDIASIESAIDDVIEYSTFSEEVIELLEIQESVEKLDKLKREYVAKTVTLSNKDPNYNLADTDERKNAIAAKVKELRIQKRNVQIKEKEKVESEKKESERGKMKALEDATAAAEEASKVENDKAKRELKIRKSNVIVRLESIAKTQEELYEAYNKVKVNVEDSEIGRRKEEMLGLGEKFMKHEIQVFNAMEKITGDLFDGEVRGKSEKMQDNLEKLREWKKCYEKFVNEEMISRELTKDKKEASTEIILEKFSGEENSQDFYSFKTKFDKKYKNVKKTQIPDILKSYLVDSALESAKELEKEDEIWVRLKSNFGDANLMLKRRMEQIYELAGSFQSKKSSRDIKDILIDLNNKIKDVVKLSEEHKIENKLHSKHEVSDIVARFPTWFSNHWYTLFVSSLKSKSDAELWKELVSFLETQTEIQKVKAESEGDSMKAGKNGKSFYQDSHHPPGPPDSKDCPYGCDRSSHHAQNPPDNKGCPLGCDRNHTEGRELLECSKFLRVRNPRQRFEAIKASSVKFCFQCLGRFNGAEHRNSCSNQYACKHTDHDGYSSKFHVTLCQNHCQEPENISLFEDFKKVVLKSAGWTANLKLSFFSNQVLKVVEKKPVVFPFSYRVDEEEIEDDSLYLLQVIEVNGKTYNLFYDNGCGSAVISKSAIDRLEEQALQLNANPITLGGVGDLVTKAEYGLYKFRLPLINGKNAILVAPCMDKITADFPEFPLDKVVHEMEKEASDNRIGTHSWPRVHSVCGGPTDIMLGIKYRKYFPIEICRLPSGLSIFKSQFIGPDGTDGLVGGPSKVVTELINHLCGENSQFNKLEVMKSYFSNQLMLYERGYQLDLDVQQFCFQVSSEDIDWEDEETELEKRKVDQNYLSKKERKFQEYEGAGCDLDYRCPKCRGCGMCLNGERLNAVSLQAEGEQFLIEEAVTADVDNHEMRAELPLLDDP